LLEKETQLILDIFFHPEMEDLRSKYETIINLSK